LALTTSIENLRRIQALLPAGFRKQGLAVTGSVFVRALLNFAGLAAFVPILASVIEPGKSNPLPVCLIVFVFIVVKNIINLWLGGVQIRYINRLFCYFSEKLYDHYFRRGLLFVKKTPSAAISNKVNGVCYQFSQNVVSLFFTMIGESLLLLFIWGGILIYSFRIALLILLSFIPIIWIYLHTVREKIHLYGKAENEVRWKQWRTVTETFKGYDEVRLNHAFPLFFNRFKNGLKEITGYREHTDRMQRIPGSMIEIYVAAGLIATVILIRGHDGLQLAFGIIALAVMRMLPALRTLLTGWIHIKNNTYTVEAIEEALLNNPSEMENRTPTSLVFHHKIEIDRISFSFPNTEENKLPVIRDFSLTIQKGERVGIRGVSGIGKSTLFNLLLGFYHPQKGEIRIDDIPLNASTCAAWHRIVGYVPQEVFIFDGSIAENIAWGESAIDEKRINQALMQSCLDTFVDTLPQGFHTHVGENGGCRLSGGQKQRIGIARALYKQAEVLFFDEATSSLDRQMEQEIAETFNELSTVDKKLTLIMIAHRESSLAFCDRIINLS
jgi:ABC-type multidrug transport system fused ATPase/permease subunit